MYNCTMEYNPSRCAGPESILWCLCGTANAGCPIIFAIPCVSTFQASFSKSPCGYFQTYSGDALFAQVLPSIIQMWAVKVYATTY